MKAEVVITREGKISIFTREGSFEEGKTKIMQLLALLAAEGIEIEPNGGIEQHRHNQETIAEEVKGHEGRARNPRLG